jgi:hypothetical protein
MQNTLNTENNNESINGPSLVDKIASFKQLSGTFVNKGIFIGGNKISHFREYSAQIIKFKINIVNKKPKICH